MDKQFLSPAADKFLREADGPEDPDGFCENNWVKEYEAAKEKLAELSQLKIVSPRLGAFYRFGYYVGTSAIFLGLLTFILGLAILLSTERFSPGVLIVIAGLISTTVGGFVSTGIDNDLSKNPDFYRGQLQEVDKTVNNPLNRLRFHTYQVGLAVERWLQKYNLLVEGCNLGLLSENHRAALTRAEPHLERAIKALEGYVQLYNWHVSLRSHKELAESEPSLPQFGTNLEELTEAVEEITTVTSPQAIESAEEGLNHEVALIELQQELGALPALVAS